MIGVLREERDFRRVYIAQLISLGGDWFAIIPLLTLLPRLTGSGIWGALVLAADTLVFALLSPYAGTVVDRVDRRRLMVISELACAVLIGLLLLVRSSSTAWISLVAIGAVAAAKAFHEPAASSAVPNLVPAADLATANALSGAAWGVMLAVGAAMGGLAAALFGARWCFAIDAVTFVISAGFVASTRKQFGQPREPRRSSVRADLRETVAYARADRRVSRLLMCKPGTALGLGVFALFPVLGARVFHVGDDGVGLLFAARGIGALIGPFVGRRFVTRNAGHLWRVIALAIVGCGGSYIAFSLNTWFPLALALVCFAHIGASINWNVSQYALQATVPDHIRGRVFSADFMIGTLALGVSQLVTAVLATLFDPRRVTVGLAATVVCYGIVWYAGAARLNTPVSVLGPPPSSEPAIHGGTG